MSKRWTKRTKVLCSSIFFDDTCIQINGKLIYIIVYFHFLCSLVFYNQTMRKYANEIDLTLLSNNKLCTPWFLFQRACLSVTQNEQKYFVSQYSVDIPEIITFGNQIRNELNWRTKTLEMGPEEINLPPVSERFCHSSSHFSNINIM